jgi:adenylate cyclase
MDASPAPNRRTISVFLADNNLIVREGVHVLIDRSPGPRVAGLAADYHEVISGCAAKEVRKLHPGTGAVVLSQYDDPEYAVTLLAEASVGYGYLLKDRVAAEGSQLADPIRCVATGGTALDPANVEALVQPVIAPGGLLPAEEELLGMTADGKTVKVIAAAKGVTPAAVDAAVESVYVKHADGVAGGQQGALNGSGCCTRRSSTMRTRARA